jgi:hypothetical protein
MSAIQGVSAAATAATAARQEATESPAVTRAEAAQGDQQAIRKLAASQPSASSQKSEKPAANGGIDLLA